MTPYLADCIFFDTPFITINVFFFFFSSRRRHTRLVSDWSSDVCSSDLKIAAPLVVATYDGRPTKIEGNPLHPAVKGASDTWAQASILDMYDPERARAFRDRKSVV